MRHAVTIGFVRGSKETVLVAPAHSPLHDQQVAIKSMRLNRTHPRFERVELWTSDGGRVSMVRFNPPNVDESPATPPTATPEQSSAKSKSK